MKNNTLPQKEIETDLPSANPDLDTEDLCPPEFDDQLIEDGEQLSSVKYTLVDDDLPVMRRPLCLINGRAYAGSWRAVKKQNLSMGSSVDPKGGIEKRIVVIRDDGKVFGGESPLGELGFEVVLPTEADPAKYLSKNGFDAFRKGEYSYPSEIFLRLKEIINHFIDFKKSLADQETMCEFIACYVLTTWGLEGFDVIGYIWITGQKGSGKTNLLMLIAELSYLGSLLSPSGSFASLRDLADSGATLACDDAENLTDPKKSEPNKRELLLSGNRRGVSVTLKEPGPDRKWITRSVNAFCPRAFSSIATPDATLASRTILVPLLRTSNKKKGNLEPLDHDAWPYDRRKILDDLWAFGLKNLPLFPLWKKWVGANSVLHGRNLQPWWAILAVAKFLDVEGVNGLYQRMESLSVEYQKKRFEVEAPDLDRVVLQALVECATRAICANNPRMVMKKVIIQVCEITDTVKRIIEEEDVDLDSNNINSRRVGKALGKFRFDQAPRSGGKGARLWDIDVADLAGLARSYSIAFDDELFAEGSGIK